MSDLEVSIFLAFRHGDFLARVSVNSSQVANFTSLLTKYTVLCGHMTGQSR